MYKLIAVLSGPLVFAGLLFHGPFAGMTPAALSVLAVTAWVAIWWITEAIPIPITSLLPIILFPLTQGLDIASTTAAYGHKLVFLYMGGFVIALAIEKWNLHKRIALTTIASIGSNPKRIILGFMLATAFLSMWISNTATSVMMLPIGMAIIKQMSSNAGQTTSGFGKALMLGIAYSASIGGISTLIGTPPNLVLATVISEYFSIELDFLNWMLMITPISAVMLMISWKYLINSFKMPEIDDHLGQVQIKKQLKELGPITRQERHVALVFGVTAFLWITRSFLWNTLFPALDDTIIALAGAVVLFIWPSGSGEKLMDWEFAVKLPWGIILLFGGGLAIAAGFKDTGLASWIGEQMGGVGSVHALLALLMVVATVNFLTEITSNVATTAMILPVLVPLAEAIEVSPMLLMIGATIAASCAFMLPVATPPNAVVFGSGYLQMRDMVRTGLIMNLCSIVIICLYLYLVVPWFF